VHFRAGFDDGHIGQVGIHDESPLVTTQAKDLRVRVTEACRDSQSFRNMARKRRLTAEQT